MSDFSAWIEKNKALWIRVHDEVIAPDFEDEWKKREELHKKEMKQREDNQQILFNHIESVAVTNSRLFAENEQFKKEASHPSENTSSIAGPGPETTATEDSTISAEEHRQLADKYDEISKKYHDLSQKIKYLERKNSAVMQKNKDMKESVRAWQEYADRQSGRQKAKIENKAEDGQLRLSAIPQIEDTRPHMPSSLRSLVTVRTPLSLADTGRSSPTPTAPLAHPDAEAGHGAVSPDLEEVEARSGSITPKPRATSQSLDQQLPGTNYLPPLDHPPNVNLNSHIGRHIHSYVQAAVPSSSQTTEDESAEQTEVRTYSTAVDDDDMPQFLSARSLKRKRGQQSKIEVLGSSDGTPVRPFRVKEEPVSSPPNIHSLVRNETIDLDDPASTLLQTPRHRPRNPLVHSNLTGTLRHSRSSSAPFTQVIKKEDTRSKHLAEPPNFHVNIDERVGTSAEIRALSAPSDLVESENNVLKHLDPNTVTETPNSHSNKRIRRSEIRQQNIHGVLAESGEEPPPVGENAVRLAPSVARAKLSRKLHGSNDPQSPAESAHQTPTPATSKIKLEQNPTPPPSSSRVGQSLARNRLRNMRTETQSVARDSPAPDDRPQWRMQALDSCSSTSKRASSRPIEHGRLRAKHFTELKVQDFKPNPAYNQGYTYAFSETVRKRGDRMCLPGCTNPQCCGSTFRIFAEAQAPLPASQEEVLLQDYLGEAYDNMRMTQMESQERQELVLQARTKKMAKEAGKHRQAYERRSTPPGFWRVDFPTTQEQQEDRERAKDHEKRVVQVRWLEAQRKGGKWIFRDE